MESEGTVTSRRALLATGGTVAFGSGVAYFAAGEDLAGDSADADASRSPATGNASEAPTADADVERMTEQENATETETEEETETATEEPQLTTGVDLDLSKRPLAGDPEATVDVYYWTDYLCSFCERFERETFPKLASEYIDTGRIRYAVLGFPLRDDSSWTALEWSHCVWRQVADGDPTPYWDWHHALFDAQESGGHNWANEETFSEVTEQTDGVTLEAVEECLDSHGGDVRATVEADAEVARQRDIQGTPGFVMYNRETGAEAGVAGAQPYENFVDAIEDVADR